MTEQQKITLWIWICDYVLCDLFYFTPIPDHKFLLWFQNHKYLNEQFSIPI